MDVYVFYKDEPPEFGPIVLGASFEDSDQFRSEKFTIEKRTTSLFVSVGINKVSHYGGDPYFDVKILKVGHTIDEVYSFEDYASYRDYWVQSVLVVGA